MDEKKSEENLKLFVLALVASLWALGFLIDIFTKSFEVPQAVHGLMGLVVGYFVGERIVKARLNK